MPLPVVTPMTVDDLDAIMALERVCFKDPWTRRMYLADLTQNELATYLAARFPLSDYSPRSAGEGGFRWRIPDGYDQSATPALPQGPECNLDASVRNPKSEILAYGGFWLMADEAHIATIASHPDWRGCGLGLYLMLALLDVAQAAGARLSTLEVRAGNLPAQRLYEKLGFQIVGRRRHYYRDGEDGLIMTTPPLAVPEMQTRLSSAHAAALRRLNECFEKTDDRGRGPLPAGAAHA
jgi:[ribosomal protein S18]-alanine N-acetyltransferase